MDNNNNEKVIERVVERASGPATIENSSISNLNVYRSKKANVSANTAEYEITNDTCNRTYSKIYNGTTKLVVVNFKLYLNTINENYWYRVALPSGLGVANTNSNVLVTFNKPSSNEYPPKEFLATLDSNYVYIASDDDNSSANNSNYISITVISIQM